MLLPAGNSSVDVANFDYVGLELNISFANGISQKTCRALIEILSHFAFWT